MVVGIEVWHVDWVNVLETSESKIKPGQKTLIITQRTSLE
jgi:hypothetical protein